MCLQTSSESGAVMERCHVEQAVYPTTGEDGEAAQGEGARAGAQESRGLNNVAEQSHRVGPKDVLEGCISQ